MFSILTNILILKNDGLKDLNKILDNMLKIYMLSYIKCKIKRSQIYRKTAQKVQKLLKSERNKVELPSIKGYYKRTGCYPVRVLVDQI